MIRNEKEYQAALDRIESEKSRFVEHAAAWRAQGFNQQQVDKLMEPLQSFHLQLVEEVQSYERLKRGQFAEFENLQGLGQTLIGLRIARGMTQRELATHLGVSETMVSRDERNEYHGITVERVKRVIEAIGVRLVTRVEVEPIAPSPPSAPSPAPSRKRVGKMARKARVRGGVQMGNRREKTAPKVAAYRPQVSPPPARGRTGNKAAGRSRSTASVKSVQKR